jgi:hypothetical protein
MPFRSSNQQKACFATKGFGGKIDCKKWQKETLKGKRLPKKVKKKKTK